MKTETETHLNQYFVGHVCRPGQATAAVAAAAGAVLEWA